MDSCDNMGNINRLVETVGLNDGPVPDSSTEQKDASPLDILRIKQQMSNQCFEMEVQLNAEKRKRSCSTSDTERDLQDYIGEIESVKTIHFNKTLALHRMQMWHAIGEKLKQNDSEADAIKAVSERCMGLCSRIKQLQQESKILQHEITEIQKKRLEMKRLTHEKMKDMEKIMSKEEHADTEMYKAVLEKGQANLEKYRKITLMTQNVFKGILLACKINWLDDPELRDIAMTLEDSPVPE